MGVVSSGSGEQSVPKNSGTYISYSSYTSLGFVASTSVALSCVHSVTCTLQTPHPQATDLVILELATYSLELAKPLEHIVRLLLSRQRPPTFPEPCHMIPLAAAAAWAGAAQAAAMAAGQRRRRWRPRHRYWACSPMALHSCSVRVRRSLVQSARRRQRLALRSQGSRAG